MGYNIYVKIDHIEGLLNLGIYFLIGVNKKVSKCKYIKFEIETVRYKVRFFLYFLSFFFFFCLERYR